MGEEQADWSFELEVNSPVRWAIHSSDKRLLQLGANSFFGAEA